MLSRGRLNISILFIWLVIGMQMKDNNLMDATVDLKVLAGDTKNFSGAEIAGMCCAGLTLIIGVQI